MAGYNGNFGMKQLMNKDLRGDYSMDFVADSSRPRSPEEKAQALGMLLQSGLVDPTDSATREYILNEVNLERLDLTDHLQYQKAERDLESMRTGMPAVPMNPFLRADIFFRIFSDFTLTEEFEGLSPELQQAIIAQAQQFQAMMQQQPAAAGGGRQQLAGQLAQAMQQQGEQQQAPNPLAGVAGVTQPAELTEQAATNQANQVAQALP